MTHRQRLAAAAAFVVLLAGLIAYLVVTPIGEQSDELAHLHYAGLIAHHVALPTDGIQERQQPPLYYAMVAAALRLSNDNLRAARWVSIVLTLVAAALVLVTLRLLQPRRPWVAVGGLWAFALLPSVQSEGAQVSNDALAWCAGALALLALVATVRAERLSSRLCLLIGGALGLALMAKATVWPLALLLAVAVVVRHRSRLGVGALATIIAPAAALSGWWFVRNLATFHRPLPPFNPLTRSSEHTLRSARQLVSWVSLSWKSTVGIEGPRQTPLVVGPGRTGLVLLALAGILLAALVAAVVARRLAGGRLGPASPAWWLLWAPPLAVAFSLVNSVTLDDQPQARYLLVAATVWCGGVAWVIATALARRPRVLTIAACVAVVAMLVLDVATVQTMRLAT